MVDITLGRADACIYCGDTGENRSAEHVIAASLGGRFVIEAASCKTCSDLTSLLELGVSRRTYHLARAYYKLPTRRPNKYPKTAEVRVKLGKYGPKKKLEVPLAEAPISLVIPQYLRKESKDVAGPVWSLAQLKGVVVDEGNLQQKVRAIQKRHKCHGARFPSFPFRVDGNFERTLWKSAYGFFWVTSRESLESSQALDFIFGKAEPYKKIDGEILVQDIFSIDKSKPCGHVAAASIYTLDEEEHSHLYCEMHFFEILGLPIYCCRIPNASGQPLERIDFAH